MKIFSLLIWLFCLGIKILPAQLSDTLYESKLITGLGGPFCVKLSYEAGALKALRDTNYTYFTRAANTSIYNPINDRVFYTNGIHVFNDRHELAENGYCLVSDIECTIFRGGATTIQGMVFIPSKEQKAWLIYQAGDDVVFNEVRRLYWAELDMSYDNGRGRITKSKQMLLDGPVMNPSEMTQVRHANGRDWWVVQPGRYGLDYHVFLVTADTIVLDHVQTIGDSVIGGLYGMARFSAQGDKYCITGVASPPQLFDFDRCSGYFSNPKRICTKEPEVDFWGDTTYRCGGRLGCIFSPSGRYLYINSYSDIRQYDLESGRDLDESYVRVAAYDSTYSTNRDPTAFFYAIQALDDKLYYCTWAAYAGGYSVIHAPELPGSSCRFEEGGLSAPTLNVYNTLPNLPFYRLGKLEGSGCDTIVGVKEEGSRDMAIALRPNPGRRVELVLPAALHEPLSFVLLNLQSEKVLEQIIRSQSSIADFTHLSAGMYFWELRNTDGSLLQVGRQVVE